METKILPSVEEYERILDALRDARQRQIREGRVTIEEWLRW
jgi:hypothetical protein